MGSKVLKSKPGVSGTLAGAGKCSSCALQGRRLRDGLVSGLSRALLVGGSHLQRIWSFFFCLKLAYCATSQPIFTDSSGALQLFSRCGRTCPAGHKGLEAPLAKQSRSPSIPSSPGRSWGHTNAPPQTPPHLRTRKTTPCPLSPI